MKKMTSVLCGMFLLACAPCLNCCDVGGSSTLQDISKPYAAEYKCKQLKMGEEDLLQDYEYLKLDLKNGGNFRCFYLDKRGNEGEYSGKYRVSKEAGEITFSSETNGEQKSYTFPYEKGTVMIRYLFGDRLLYGEFSAVE